VTPPEHTPLDDLRDAVAELQRERVESRDHRTRVQTLLTLAGAAAIAVVLGAVTVRDAVLRQEAATTALTARVVALEAASGRRDTDDRATSAAIVRLQTTLETLQSTIAHRLDAIDQRLQTAPPR
jgi:hypothetical protein